MIYYIAFYGKKGFRTSNLAAEDKIDYICDSLVAIGKKIKIISNAKTSNGKYQKQDCIKKSCNIEIVYFSSFPRINLLYKILDTIISTFQFVVYFLKNINPEDTVIVYHSLAYGNMINILHKIKRFHYILEVEELYQYIQANKSRYKQQEDAIIQHADGYIFSNKIIESRINSNDKQFIVVNGVYKPKAQLNIKKREHSVVYAGTLEPQKGIDYVLKAAQFLPSYYEIHVAGFGTQKDIDHLETTIELENAKNGAKVCYDGSFKGDEYTQYLQSFKVGICIQDPDDTFNKYEFPSKIFSYISNGLHVVANDLSQLRESSIYPYLYISSTIEPEDIAMTIIKAFSDECTSSVAILEELNNNFIKEIKGLIGD